LDFYTSSYDDFQEGLEAIKNNTAKMIFFIGKVKLTGINITNSNKSTNPNIRNSFLLTINFTHATFSHTHGDALPKPKRTRVRLNQNVTIPNLTDVFLSICAGLIKLKPDIFGTQTFPNFEFIKQVICFLFESILITNVWKKSFSPT
jgi:hypothetical protein